ncbi:MAG: ABC transporter permease [Anaerolineae bacterium]|nr:ABC transporter permease [Anaerolineae bacterium]
MAGAVFRKALFDARRGILGWGIALALYAAFMILLYPYLTEIEGYRELLQNLPVIFKGMLGGIDEMLSPEGYIAGYLFSYAPLVLCAYGILSGASSVAGEEKRGTIDLLMSAPVPRWRVILEKFAAFLVSLIGILAITFVGMVIGLALTPELAISIGRLAETVLNVVPITLAFGALAFFLSATLPTRLSAALFATAVLVAFYMVNVLAPLTTALDPVQAVNPFHYYGTTTMFEGIDVGNALVLLVVTGVLLALCVVGFERRDLAV